jgi:hypothetical protein
LISLAVLPGLVSSVVDTLNLQRQSGGNYVKGTNPFVVIIGRFDSANRVQDVLNAFLYNVSMKPIQIA